MVALGVSDVNRAAAFWCQALGYEMRTDGFGGWAVVLVPSPDCGLRTMTPPHVSAPAVPGAAVPSVLASVHCAP